MKKGENLNAFLWIAEISSGEPSQTTDMFEHAGLLSRALPLILPLHSPELSGSEGLNPKIERLYLQISSQNFQQILPSPYIFLSLSLSSSLDVLSLSHFSPPEL